MSTIIVRQAVFSDIEALSVLFDGYRQFYGQESNAMAAKDFLKSRFNHGESVIFIAENSGSVIGFTQLYPSFSSVSMRRIFVLNDLFVCESSRNEKVGARLLTSAIEFAKSVGAVRLSLSTAVTNKTAQTLYESSGWKKDEKFFHYEYAL